MKYFLALLGVCTVLVVGYVVWLSMQTAPYRADSGVQGGTVSEPTPVKTVDQVKPAVDWRSKLLTNATIRVPEEKNVIVSISQEMPLATWGDATNPKRGSVALSDAPVVALADGSLAAVISVSPGGSGQFLYLTVFQAGEASWQSAESVLLGDRVVVESLTATDNTLHVQYATLGGGQSQTDIPKVKNVATFAFENGKLQTLTKVDGSLLGKSWTWVKTVMKNGSTVTPKQANAFSLTFGEDGRLAIGTDCNKMSAAYQAAGGQLRVMPIISTKMACQGSQEQVFADALAKADSYMVEESGTLILYLANEAGEITLQ